MDQGEREYYSHGEVTEGRIGGLPARKAEPKVRKRIHTCGCGAPFEQPDGRVMIRCPACEKAARDKVCEV